MRGVIGAGVANAGRGEAPGSSEVVGPADVEMVPVGASPCVRWRRLGLAPVGVGERGLRTIQPESATPTTTTSKKTIRDLGSPRLDPRAREEVEGGAIVKIRCGLAWD